MRAATLGLVLLLPPLAAWGGEDKIRLVDAPGKELVSARCVVCHSLDYLPMNSKFLDRAGWAKEVKKMTEVMGAPVTPQEAPKIVDYLTKYYGRVGK